MRKVILFLLLISYFNNANADFNKLTQNGISSIFLKSCSELLDVYEKAEKVDDTDLITNMFGMAFLGVITGYNIASHMKTPDQGFGVETYSTDPDFLFQYLVNKCKKNPDDNMAVPMLEYISEQAQLDNVYNW